MHDMVISHWTRTPQHGIDRADGDIAAARLSGAWTRAA
jgi:hypothetical protein